MRILFSNGTVRRGGPAIFIDRDGVINCRRPGDYVLNWSQFIFTPGIREALRKLASLQLPMIMISNQAAVGKGLLTSSGLEEITNQMYEALLQDGTWLIAAYFCTHRPDERCTCRKPHPELLNRAAADFGIDLARSVFIGDSDSDVRAARAAGCQPILFGPGLTSCSDSSDWMNNTPTAHTPSELYQVTVDSLRAAGQAASEPSRYAR